MKIFVLFLAAIVFFSQVAEAKINAKALLAELKANRANRIKLLETPLVKFILSPESPRQGDPFSAFLQPSSTISGVNHLLDAFLDGVPVSLEAQKNLWIFHSSGLHEVKSYELKVDVSIEDSAESARLREAIRGLDLEILAIEQELAGTTDPQRIAELTALRDEKLLVKNGLIAELVALKQPIGSQTFHFNIRKAAASNPNYPKINSVFPSYGAIQGGTAITINGGNFPASNLEVKIGGLLATITSSTDTAISAVTPSFGIGGAKHVEVRALGATPQDPVKNAVLNNGFFAVDVIPAPTTNVRPVARAGNVQTIQFGQQVSLDGSLSYDENGNAPLGFSWKFVSVPSGSSFPVDTEFNTDPSFSFQPDRAGSFVLSLVVKETNTPDFFESYPSLTVVQVSENQPPVIPSLFYTIRSQGVPYQVSLSTLLNAAITDSDGIQSMVWEFGDGTSERVFDPAGAFILHNFMSTGQFLATLRVIDSLGAVSTNSILVNVVETDIPTAKFTVNPASGAVPLTVTFDASASSDANGITQYRWLWGSGAEEVTTSPVITHTFTTAGTFSVRLRTRDTNLVQGEGRVNVFAGGTGSAAAQAQFLVGPPREVILGSPHAFDGSRSFNPNVGGTLEAYNWTWGDFLTCPSNGCTGIGLTASYTYPTAMNYFPGLQVQTGTGSLSQRVFQEVFVVNAGHAPRAIARLSTTSGVAPLAINASGSESYDYAPGTISSFSWNFGDGSTASGATASHVYSTPGVYQLILSTIDSDENRTDVAQTITATSALELAEKRAEPQDAEREYERQLLANACAVGQADACYYLGIMYQEDGDAFTKQKLWEKACSLGYQEACVSP